ncbi:unnamed protein product [Oppiella nova]|uniref:Innexin n=1 Tax=Oppiella nova TaxID=334625 RepID=A0A7R9LNE0_9ACAR|nr:unnamed protein product [Oppiella nova]CAG2165360.1 unnamed protein product [Oppiella nova]
MAMNAFKSVARMATTGTECIDNTVFQLHYKATFVGITGVALIVAYAHIFGAKIYCHGDNHLPSDIVKSFCWQRTEFSFPKPVIHAHNETAHDYDNSKYNSYFKWIYPMLFFQAIWFYIPRYLWIILEGDLCGKLISGLGNTFANDADKKIKIRQSVEYIRANAGKVNLYLVCYVICEILNLINVAIQLYLTDKFMGRVGFKMVEFTMMNQDSRTDPMIAVFPRLIRCLFPKFANNGSVTTYDFMCVLPFNSINEKIYIVLWFWLIILTTISGINIIYRLLTIKYPLIRALIIRLRVGYNEYLCLKQVLQFATIGDWFVLYQLSKNIDYQDFKFMMDEVSQRISRI